MKIKIIDSDSNFENESDYETAVDMSHSSMCNVSYRLITLSGLEISLSYTKIETSYSYYEEDIPDDFKIGDPVQYNRHSNPDKSRNSEYGHMEILLSEQLVILNKEEFLDYFNNFIQKDEGEKYELSQSSEIGKKFYRFEQQQEGYRDEENLVSVGGKDEVVAMLEIISKKKENIWFEIELPESLRSIIKSWDAKNEEINSRNSNNIINNMCTQANARLNIFIDKLTHDTKVELGFEAKSAKLKM